jgi:hypothetical protein
VISNSALISPNKRNEGFYHPTIGTSGMYENKSLEGLWTFNPNNSFTWGY